MKKFSKILCAVLVIAVLCSSLIFMVGAEESAATSNLLAGYTSVSMIKEDGGKLLEAIKYPADDNLLNGAGISDSNATDTIAWGSEGGRGSDLITHTASGNVIYKEYLVGSTDGKYGEGGYQKNGNDYVNYSFSKVDLTKEDGYNKYIVVDFDFAYEGATDGLAFQVITRGNGAYWATTQQFRNLGIAADTVVHVTAVYDYSTGDSHMFVNGKFVTTVDNGALTDTGSADYEAGVTMGASEFRVGSNSSMTIYLDSLYVRSVKNATDSDSLGSAVAAKSIAGWTGNIYGAGYSTFSIPYFVKSLSVNDFANNSIQNSGVYVEESENNVTYVATGNADNSPFLTIATAGSNPYLVAYCNTTTSYKGASNNLFFNANVPNTEPFTVVGEDAKGYYVVDFDIATHGNMLPEIDVSVVMRRESDTSGYPFSDELYIGHYVTEANAWSHVTIVGDIANNVAKLYINGQFVADLGLAVRNAPNDPNKLANDTRVVAQGYRIELTRNNIQTDMTAGDNVAFDNFSHRLYIENGDALTAALADGNITDWADNLSGRAGEKLPVIATVDGVEYRNAKALEEALFSNDELTVEFLGQPVVPVLLHANCTVNTYGMDISKLVKLDAGCEIVSTNGNVATIKAPYAANETVVKTDKTTVLNLVKSAVEGNIISTGTIFSEYYRTDAHGRTTYLVTNTATGKQYIRDTVDTAGTLATDNTYIDWKVDSADGKGRIDYVLGEDQFIVFDIDFALHTVGEKYNVNEKAVAGTINLNPVSRNSSNGGVWGNNNGEYINLLTQAGVEAGEFVHLTAVISPDTLNMDVFINGKHVTTIEKAISAASGNNFSSMRMFSSCTSTANYHNVALRAVKSSELTAAVAAKNISAWSGNVYTSSYELPEMATLATVNGVGYTVPTTLAAALIGNDEAEVKLLHAFSEEIVVSCPAVINTNGLAHNFVICEGGSVTANGDILTFTAPYVANDHIVGEGINPGTGTSAVIDAGDAMFDAIYYNADDNLFAKVVYQNYFFKENFRTSYLMTDPVSGNKYLYDTVYSGNPTGQNTYMNWHFGGDVATKGKGYSLGVNQYLVMDFDVAFDKYANTNINFTTRDSENTNIAGTGFHINVAMQNAGVAAGHFAHITILAEVDTNTVYVYVNGVKQQTVTNGLTRLDMAEGYWLDGIRALQNLDTSIKYDNMYMRVVEDATLAGLNTLVGHSINVYTNSYVLPTLPKFANVDGVDYYSAAEVSAALYGNVDTPKQVEFFHEAEGTVYVTCDAVIKTNGLNIDLSYYHGDVTDKGNGVYEFDCGYVSSTTVENVTSTSTFGAAVLVPGNNLISGIFFSNTGSWMNTHWYDEAGNTVYGMHTYLVSSEGMDNSYGMIALPEGTSALVGAEYYTKNASGEIVKASDTTGTYINLEHASADTTFTYSASENNYWVYDFDVLVEGEAINMHPYALIKTADGGFQYGTFDLPLGQYAVENGNKGQFNHVTIVADYNNNLEYIYINDVFVATSPLMAAEAPATAYVEGNTYKHYGLRISVGTDNYTDDASLALDNVLARKFVTSNSDNLADALAAQDITLWTGRYSYTLPETPDLGTVNGTMYNNVGDLEAAISANPGCEVELVRAIRGNIAVDVVATVETNAFADVVAKAYDGFYEFELEGYGTVKATNKYVAIENGTVYNVTEINADNYADYATLVLFYTGEGIDEYQEVYYAFIYGEQIVAPDWNYDDHYDSEEGVLKQAKWFDADGNLAELPVASAALGELYFELKWADKSLETEMDVQVQLTVGTDFIVKIYVEAALLMDGTYDETEEIDGVVYAVFSKALTANKLGEVLLFELFAQGNDYPEYKTVTVAKYAEELFAGEYDVLDKNLMAAALVYANEAYKLLGGNADFAELIEANAEYVLADAELTEKLPTDIFEGWIRSAAMYLDETPKFAFKVAMGFDGTIKFTYTSLGETVEVEKLVNTVDGEELVVIDSFKVYDIHSTIAIEIIPAEGETIVGAYNLASYAQSLADNAFAVALYNYATVAEQYMTPAAPAPELSGHEYSEITRDEVSEGNNLLLVNDSKIKQMDQATLGDSNGYFTKEGGIAKFILIEKNGAMVEALYFSRAAEYDWDIADDNTQNNGFAEHRYSGIDKTQKIASISFDYIINGTCSGEHATYGEGYLEIKTADGKYVGVVNGADAFIKDGEWHTLTWEATADTYITDILVKLYRFNGEFAIANLVIDYVVEPVGPTLAGNAYTEITREEVTSDTLVLVNDSKIKQMDQATLGDSNGYFTKEGGTAKFILIEKNGAMVEALYFSRAAEYDWDIADDNTQNNGFAEHRYSGIDKTQKIASISFDYIIDGTCSGEHATYGEGYLEIKTADGKYVGVVNGADAFIKDGEWHTLTWEATADTYITDILVKLYRFNGEFAIANLVITYAE